MVYDSVTARPHCSAEFINFEEPYNAYEKTSFISGNKAVCSCMDQTMLPPLIEETSDYDLGLQHNSPPAQISPYGTAFFKDERKQRPTSHDDVIQSCCKNTATSSESADLLSLRARAMTDVPKDRKPCQRNPKLSVVLQNEISVLRDVSPHLMPPECLSKFPIAERWKCLHKIGNGSFGEIYLGIHIETGNKVAIKTEPLKTCHPQLLHEAKILSTLQKLPGLPRIYHFGVHANKYGVMVMEFLGPSLEDVFVRWGNRYFSIATTVMLASQMLHHLESIHNEGFIHRDIKPENFLMGRNEKNNKVFPIDFGLARRYCDSKTKKHMPYHQRRTLTGTARYVSLNTHIGIEPSRRDDIESCGYIMVYFLKGGHLPWQGIKALSKHDKYSKIMHTKMSTSLETLTAGLPLELYKFLNYCRRLTYDQTPDYFYLQCLLSSIILRETNLTSLIPASDETSTDILDDFSSEDSKNNETAEMLERLDKPVEENNSDSNMHLINYMERFEIGLEKTYLESNEIFLKGNEYSETLACIDQKVQNSNDSDNSNHQCSFGIKSKFDYSKWKGIPRLFSLIQCQTRKCRSKSG